MDLKEKVKKAILHSSFPLEMKIGKKLQENDWDTIIGQPYYDFEFDILRETDIVARKEIGIYTVNLFIECKKSQDKQLVLYMPYTCSGHNAFVALDLKKFPRKEYTSFEENESDNTLELSKHSKLYNLDEKNLFCQNIIFTKGDNIYQDNQKFFSSLSGLIKSSIWFYKEMLHIEKQEIYLYLVIYDGFMYGMLPPTSQDDLFDLVDLDYGMYKPNLLFNSTQINSARFPDYRNYMELFGTSFVIQIIRPIFIDRYLDEIERVVKEFDLTILE